VTYTDTLLVIIYSPSTARSELSRPIALLVLAPDWMEILRSTFMVCVHAGFRECAPYINEKAENRGTPNKRKQREYFRSMNET
jgi:hypothetical protein